MDKGSEQFSKEDIQMDRKLMKTFSTSSAIREMRRKTTLDTTSHSLGWLKRQIIKKTDYRKCCGESGEIGTLLWYR